MSDDQLAGVGECGEINAFVGADEGDDVFEPRTRKVPEGGDVAGDEGAEPAPAAAESVGGAKVCGFDGLLAGGEAAGQGSEEGCVHGGDDPTCPTRREPVCTVGAVAHTRRNDDVTQSSRGSLGEGEPASRSTIAPALGTAAARDRIAPGGLKRGW